MEAKKKQPEIALKGNEKLVPKEGKSPKTQLDDRKDV